MFCRCIVTKRKAGSSIRRPDTSETIVTFILHYRLRGQFQHYSSPETGKLIPRSLCIYRQTLNIRTLLKRTLNIVSFIACHMPNLHEFIVVVRVIVVVNIVVSDTVQVCDVFISTLEILSLLSPLACSRCDERVETHLNQFLF